MMPLRGGLAPLTLASKAPVLSWWLSGGVSAANCIAAYAPKGAASLAASYVNLANPGTKDAATGTAPTWDATNGWKFAGASSQYLTTGIYATGSTTVVLKLTNWNRTASYKTLFGAYESNTKAIEIQTSSAASIRIDYYHNAQKLNVLNSSTSGVLALAGGEFYVDGSLVTSATPATNTMTRAMLIGAVQDATVTEFSTVYIQLFAVYNAKLTVAQIQAIGAAMP